MDLLCQFCGLAATSHVGRLTELECGCCRCTYQKFSRVSLLRLSCSSSLFGRFYFMHSLRSKFLPNLKKKSRRFFLKMKKVRDTFRKIFENFRDFSKFLTFSKIFDFSDFFYRTSYRKFSKKIENFRKCQKSQNFWENFRKVALTFFIKKKKR